jgi:hypothetical protein
MDIINSLKSRIGGADEIRLSQFLGESADSVDRSMVLSLNAMLGGLKEIAKKEGDASGIMKVINDGGHSGDLTDDLSGLFKNSDKIQLLITIGKNINNHFFKDKVDGLIDKISSQGAISKISASSLLSLSAPLVLGALGKNIRLEGLDIIGFTSKLLNESLTEGEDLIEDLKYTTNAKVEVKAVEEVIVEENTVNRSYQRKEKSGDALNWIAWVMLALLGLAVAFYTFKDKYIGQSAKKGETVNVPQDTSSYDIEEDIFDALNTDRKNNFEKEDIIKEETVPRKVVEPVTEKPVIAKSESKVPTPTSNSIVVQKTPSLSINSNRSSFENASTLATTDNRPMSTKLNTSGIFFGINGLNYENNSAEIRNRGSVRELVNYLKGNLNRKIQIGGTGSSARLAEDRAYGLQGVLFDLGVNINQTEILTYSVAGNGPVMVKIK